MDSAYFASRYDKGTPDYINCPLSREEYLAFWQELVSAQEAEVHGFEDKNVFEGCMPVEVMARRGEDTLRFGPLKPRGLPDPKTGKEPYAVVQLRRDNADGTIYNLVGFQTHLKWGEQKRVFSMIPALRNAVYLRYGVMHRNTYLNSPQLLDRYYRLQSDPRIAFAGQMTGVEGYVESCASGFLVGVELARRLKGQTPIDFPRETAIGALGLYISNPTVADFQPGHSLKLARSDTYHGTKAASNVVEFMQYSDADALSKALTDGSLDMAAPVSASTATGLNGKDGLTVKEGATTDKVLLAYNNGTDSLLSDEQARKAFRYQIDAAGIASAQPDAAGALGGPISPLEPGYEDLTGLYPHDENQAGQMFSYFGAQYLTTVNLVVPEEYRSLAETIKQQIERQPRPTVNLEVLSDEDYAKRIKDGKWELTVMSMDGTDDAGIFADPDSMFHYDHTEAQQAYADARAATNDADYEARMKAYARLISEDAASDWLYTRKCFTVASTKISGYPTSMINRRMPLAGLTVK